MRAVVTRVSSASVMIEDKVYSSINRGFLVLLGVHADDDELIAAKMADKVCGLRVFSDEAGKMNLSLSQVEGELLVVSNFTLYADCSQRRPGFTSAARPEKAEKLYELFMESCRSSGFRVSSGVFGADMLVNSANDGPVTIIIDSDHFKSL